MADNGRSDEDEIASLKGELAACRFCLALALNMLTLGNAQTRSAIREKIGLASVITDDDRVREGFDRFKERLLESLPSDNP